MRGRDGAPRETWYARFTRNGQKVNVNLCVPIRGKVPLDAEGNFNVGGKGDEAFEKSRKAALKALAEMEKAAKTTGKTQAVKDAETADMINRFHRARTGKAIESPRLRDLPTLWNDLERTYTPTAERVRTARANFARFEKFARAYCRANGGNCDTIDEITDEIAKAWFASLKAEYAWGTVKDQWHLLSNAWVRWHVHAQKNPFGKVMLRSGNGENAKVERKPLTEAELARLFNATEDAPQVHRLVVCAACTGMRIGDVCNLKWSDVDLKGGFIDCVTAKAGVRVTIPLFTPLRKVLDEAKAKHAIGDSPFVFPVAASQYNHRNEEGYPDQRTGIVRMVKPFFAKAVFPAEEPERAQLADAEPLPTDEVLARIEAARFAPTKKERLREIFTRFRGGDTCCAIALDMGIARGQVSAYLKDIESLTGETYRPRIERIRSGRRNPSAGELIARTRQERKVGKHAASLYGWHNLRHTFVVLALQSGVPVESVRKIVGHGDVETTLANYFNPTKETEAERVRKQMSGTVLETGGHPALPAARTGTHLGNVAPTGGKALALARAVLSGDEARTVDSVLMAAGIIPDAEPQRALALIAATVPAKTQKRIAAVISAAGL